MAGFQVYFHRDTVNHCPYCGHSQWVVGRVTAECGLCHSALPIKNPEFSGGGISRVGSGKSTITRQPMTGFDLLRYGITYVSIGIKNYRQTREQSN